MKSFEDINILIKVKLFAWKPFFGEKSFYMKKTVFENKNLVLKKV